MQDQTTQHHSNIALVNQHEALPSPFVAMAEVLRVLMLADAEGKLVEFFEAEGLGDAFAAAMGMASDVIADSTHRLDTVDALAQIGSPFTPVVMDPKGLGLRGFTIWPVSTPTGTGWYWNHAESAAGGTVQDSVEMAWLEASSSVLAAYSDGVPHRAPVAEAPSGVICLGESAVAIPLKQKHSCAVCLGDAAEPIRQVDYAALLKQLLVDMSGLGFGAASEINGGDAVEKLAQCYVDVCAALKGTPLEPVVIYAASEDGFWSNCDGWGDFETATHFYGDVEMPMAAGNDAQFLLMSNAERSS